jgi:DNA polymerase
MMTKNWKSMISLFEINKEINQIEQDIANCKRCDLWKTRNNPVPGEGSVTAKVMFIGEAPGYNEDMQGRPFVGKAGGIFDELLHSVELKREEIYIANILKCRPPKNRDPLEEEIKTCTPYLDKQIACIKPSVVATLGNFATSFILKKYKLLTEKIGKVHGKIYTIKNSSFTCIIIPMYHPAAAVYNPKLKLMLIEDFNSIKKILK